MEQETISVTATVARREFGRILDLVAQDRRVIITRYNRPVAVLMPAEKFGRSATADTAILDTLTAEFDAMLERMQTPEARAVMERAFNASPEELSWAAAAAVLDGR